MKEGSMSQAKRRKKNRLPGHFVTLGKKMLFQESEWKRLSASEKLLYIYIKAKYNGSNNGEINLYYSELKGIRGLSSPCTISKSILGLEKGGWIKRTQNGGLFRYKNEFRLTGTHDNCIS